MRYTNYILHGNPVRCEQLGVVAIPAAVVAVPVLLGFLGGAAIMDGGRILKLKYLLYQREQRRINYIRCVLISLDRKPNNQLISLLRAA